MLAGLESNWNILFIVTSFVFGFLAHQILSCSYWPFSQVVNIFIKTNSLEAICVILK